MCPGYYPLVRPTFAASQVFVYHDAAIKDFRGYATNRFFEDLLEDYSVRPSVFKAAWDEITGLQLGSTLTDLSPANRVGLFTTTVPIRSVLTLALCSCAVQCGAVLAKSKRVQGFETEYFTPPLNP